MMVSVRAIAIILVAAGLVVSAPLAHADDAGPLRPLVDAAAQRLQTAYPVAAYKWVNGGSIEDPARVAQVLDTVGADASGRGIDPGFVRAAFENQIHATEGVEYILFGHWKFAPDAAPATAPDLAESRTAIDGFNKTMVAEMASQWGVLHGPNCAAELDGAKRAVAAARGLDPLNVDALDVATGSYCAT
jgi:chorismate mutase